MPRPIKNFVRDRRRSGKCCVSKGYTPFLFEVETGLRSARVSSITEGRKEGVLTDILSRGGGIDGWAIERGNSVLALPFAMFSHIPSLIIAAGSNVKYGSTSNA